MEQEGITKPVYVSPNHAAKPSRAQLYAALSQAQAEIEPPKKDKKVDFRTKAGGILKYNYADLASVFKAIKKPFQKHGLCILQPIETQNSKLYIRTILAHKSGESAESVIEINRTSDPKEQASILTYFKRYSLCAMVGVESEEDTDAPRPQPKPPAKPQAKAKPAPGRQIPSPSKPDEIVLWIRNIVQVKQLNTEMNQMLDIMEHKSLEDCSMAELKEVVKWVKEQ